MSLFRVILGTEQRPDPAPAVSRDERPAWMRDGLQIYVSEGSADLEVVGESHRQENLWQLAGGRSNPQERVRVPVLAVLVPETSNPYDSNAVSVWVNGLQVGYLSREDARRYRPGLLSLQREHGKPIALRGVIVGGGMYQDGPGRLGVFLRHNPADFGLQPPPVAVPTAHIRTGLSEAFAADGVTATPHLAWLQDLPSDDIPAITALRQLLAREADPLSRHYMHAQLEAALYRSREAFASALDEYDEACQRHDAEMDSIRGAFMAEWGEVPLLEIYRQMAIRQQKAKRFDKALWWTERGIAIYGSDAARPEAVADLRHRAVTYRAKLTPVVERVGARPSRDVDNSDIEALVCATCGHEFRRARVRGRKPMHCPECAGPRSEAARARQLG